MTKTLQVSKLMFAEWKLECVIKRIGLSSNQIKNQKNYWMELLWIKNRSSYSKISCNDLENSKSSFIKMLVLKLDNLYDMINNSYKRNLRKHFTRYQSNIQRIRTNEIKILADKLFNLAYAITNKHVVRNINQKLSQRAFKLLNPHFKISSSKYDVCRRKYLLKWRLNIEKNKSNYLEALIPNIYKTLYDQIQKEYALRQTLKEKQKLINSNLKDTKKLIYKLVS